MLRMLASTGAACRTAVHSAALMSTSENMSRVFTRNVASFTGGRLFGNVVEAWEMREVAKITANRKPEHFESFKVGDSLAVRSINPYNNKRLVTFQGVCISIRNGLLGKSFTLRNNIDGVGVEQHFAFYSPLLKVNITFVIVDGIGNTFYFILHFQYREFKSSGSPPALSVNPSFTFFEIARRRNGLCRLMNRS
jgi:ribosomal protein L19